jgi:hypothetical protein
MPKEHRWNMLVVAIGLGIGACKTTTPPRYIVTATPIDVLGGGHLGLCLAVDPTDTHGVWWWEPGPSGCAKRTTGPAVFHGDEASVVASSASGAVDVRFRLQLTTGFRDVHLELQGGAMQLSGSASRVATGRRGDLDVPFAFGR